MMFVNATLSFKQQHISEKQLFFHEQLQSQIVTGAQVLIFKKEFSKFAKSHFKSLKLPQFDKIIKLLENFSL